MPHIRRTFTAPPGIPVTYKPEVFYLNELNKRVVGAFVNSKVIYDLKKKGKSVVQLEHGCAVVFEVLTPDMVAAEVQAQIAQQESATGATDEKPQHDI